MTDFRYAIPLDDFVVAAQVRLEDQVEVQADVVVPPPAGGGTPAWADDAAGDADGD